MGIVDWIFPKICVGCGDEGGYICTKCQHKLMSPEPICPMCCKPSIDGWTHPRCQRGEGMGRLIVGLSYRGLVQECLKKVKYKSGWDMISFLFDIWRENCSDTVPRDTVITSVPMWQIKENKRGFNQAETLAKLVSEKSKVPYLVLLERARETRPMFGLKKKERTQNIEGAFKISYQQTNKLTGKRVILVDDVWTTGATMRECAKVLKKSGVTDVWGLALAR